jgi:hypothetical protein
MDGTHLLESQSIYFVHIFGIGLASRLPCGFGEVLSTGGQSLLQNTQLDVEYKRPAQISHGVDCIIRFSLRCAHADPTNQLADFNSVVSSNLGKYRVS